MSLSAEVDGEVDLGPLVFELMGGIKASLDGLTKEIKRTRDIEAAYQRGAIEVPLRNAKSSASSGNLIIGLGGPAYGRLWEVKRLVIGGALYTSTVAGSAVFAVGPASGQLTPALTDVVDDAASLPNIAFYSTRQLVVRHPNHLFVVVISPSVSTQYACGGEATDLPDRRFALTTEG